MSIEEIYELMKKNIGVPMGITIRAICYDDNGDKQLGFDTVSVDFTKENTFDKIKELSEECGFIAWLDDPNHNDIIEKYQEDNGVSFYINDEPPIELQQDIEFVINRNKKEN